MENKHDLSLLSPQADSDSEGEDLACVPSSGAWDDVGKQLPRRRVFDVIHLEPVL